METRTLYTFPACPKCKLASGVIKSKREEGWWYCFYCKQTFKDEPKEKK